MLYSKKRKLLFQQHPLTDTLFLYTMLKQETNPAVVNNSSPSTYCFDVEAVQRFFSTVISVESFARSMRAYNNEISLTFMVLSDSESEEPIPSEVVKGAIYLNKFLETLNPYFTNSKNN